MDRAAIIIQARLTSNRFPNKVLANLAGKPVLMHLIDNLSEMKEHAIDVIFAIPDTPQNDALESWLTERGQKVFRGTENDVLARYYQCATINRINTIIRVCADTPLIKIGDIWENLMKFNSENGVRMIYGQGSWIFSYEMLQEAFETQGHAESREHVVRSMFNSIDYPDDIQRLEKLIA